MLFWCLSSEITLIGSSNITLNNRLIATELATDTSENFSNESIDSAQILEEEMGILERHEVSYCYLDLKYFKKRKISLPSAFLPFSIVPKLFDCDTHYAYQYASGIIYY